MGISVIEQWKAELAHCKEWSNSAGVERATEQLRSLGVEVTNDGDLADATTPAKKVAPRREARKVSRRTAEA